MFKPTHTGIIRRMRRGQVCAVARIPLQELGLFWVTRYGAKYRKSNGTEVGKRVNVSVLDLSSILP